MIAEAMNDIMDGLLRKSRKGQVNWLPSAEFGLEDVVVDDFVVSLPESTLNIFRESSGQVYLAILDSRGKLAFRVGEEALSSEKLTELLELAKFKARRIADTLEYVKRMLYTDDAIGAERPVAEISQEEIPF